MGNTFTVLWSKDRCELVRKHNQIGEPLNLLFGGPHISMLGFRRFGVREGDAIYPVRVLSGVVHVLGRIHVQKMMTLTDYVAQNPKLFPDYVPDVRGYADITAFGAWLQRNPEKVYLAPTCTDEVVMGSGTPLRLDNAMPPEMLERLRIWSKKGERSLKHVVEGRLTAIIDLQGVYRLSPESAPDIASLVTAEG